MKEFDAAKCAQILREARRTIIAMADLLEADAAPAEAVRQTEKPVTKEEVRAVLAAKTSAGYGKEIRALLGQFGATQLSDIMPESYADLMEAAKRIGTEAQNG